MKVLHITAQPCTVELLDISDRLENYQQLVDGYIEIVHAAALQPYHAAMVVNECGLLDDLPCNPLASILYGDYIAGNVVIVGTIGSDFTDIPDELTVLLSRIGGN